VAFACHCLGISGKLFMPVTTPFQKLRKAELFGKAQVKIVRNGATLLQMQDEICSKNVACLASAGNNDMLRMEEITERAFLYRVLKPYFLISFP
jgi:threonine dehydratase